MLKKVLLITPDLAVGGAQRVVTELAAFFHKQGKEVMILCLFRDKPVFYTLNKNISVLMPSFTYKLSLVSLIRLFTYIRTEAKKFKPDIILSFHHRYNPFVIVSLLFTRYPVYVSDRSSPYNKLKPFFLEWMRRLFYPCAAGLIVQTDLARQIKKKQRLNKNIYVLPNPIKQSEATINAPAKADQIIYVARLDHRKGHAELLRAFAKVPDAKNWKLVLAGDGSLLHPLQQMAQDLGIAGQVVFAGARKDVDTLLKESRIFAFPSLSEGFPNALLEAMGAGLPCVSFDCISGPSELITDGINGFLVAVGDEDTFAKKLKLLMNDGELRNRLGSSALQVNEKYHPESVLTPFITYLENSRYSG